MARKSKELREQHSRNRKTINEVPVSTDISLIVWSFDQIDRNGKFAFNIERSDFDGALILSKLIEYSSMTWQDLKQQTHDGAKSKKRSIPIKELSKEAQQRLRELHRKSSTDSLFFIALSNYPAYRN